MVEMKIKAMEKQLLAIYHKRGHVTPSLLVEASKPKTSITHDCFTWDDKVAGDKWRLAEARTWIRHVKVQVREAEPKEVFPFVHVPSPTGKGEGVYKPLVDVVESLPDYDLAFSEAIAGLHTAQRRVDELKNMSAQRNDDGKLLAFTTISQMLLTAQEMMKQLH